MSIYDMSVLTEEDLKLLVSECCSDFGAVDEVQILHFERPEPSDFALVSMASPDDAKDVVDALGGVGYGCVVIVRLQLANARRTAPLHCH